ncbi:MAG: MOSC domain-containing protein [Acidimicrobiia bacterium]|nr:MOSC domain-containing protein [Acidimicrobiia bacterium]
MARDVERAAGEGARLMRFDGPERFDILPLLVATDGAMNATGEDWRRFRPNLIIGGVEGLTERQWEHRQLRVGSSLIQAHDLRGRCIMTTFHPDTLQQDVGVLRRIQQQFEGVLGLNCSVIEGGSIQVGDPVDVL